MNEICTEQDHENYMSIMAGHDAVIARELDALLAANKVVLDQIQAMVSPEAFQQIKDTLCDSGYTHGYMLADQPVGEPQDDGFVLGDVFIHETTNGGITGDEYAGTMSMPLSAGRFFQFCYAC